MEWGKTHVTDDEIYVETGCPLYGRENDIHITALYGIEDKTPGVIVEAVSGFGEIAFQLKNIDIFPTWKFDVLVIDVVSEDLHKLNQMLCEITQHADCYQKYKPHITVAYVKKGFCRRYQNNKTFKNKSFICNKLVFSSSNGSKQILDLL
jgi:2'-5' RNA ligase